MRVLPPASEPGTPVPSGRDSAARTIRSGLVRGGLAVTAVVIGYLVGVLPAPASATIDHCYVTYDRQERQYSRCVAHWTRAGRDVRGLVHGVPVGTGWQALTTDPDDTYEWEVSVPDAHRRQDVLTVLTHGWVVPRFVQVSLALAVVASLGFLGWLARRRPRRRQA